MPTSQTTSTAIFPDWEICPSSEGICGGRDNWPIVLYVLTAFAASQESLTPPCFFDGPLSSSFLPSSLGEHFLGEAFASTGCFDLDPNRSNRATLFEQHGRRRYLHGCGQYRQLRYAQSMASSNGCNDCWRFHGARCTGRPTLC